MNHNNRFSLDEKVPTVSCVYKITLEDGSFYIGSTQNLRTRVCSHNTVLRGHAKGRLYERAKESKMLYIEIVAKAPSRDELLKLEYEEIGKNIGNDLLLNTHTTLPCKSSTIDIKRVEAVLLLSHGLSVSEAAEELGTNKRKLEKHLEILKAVYEAKTVTHLVATLLRKNIID